jgi:hypothetical protein
LCLVWLRYEILLLFWIYYFYNEMKFLLTIFGLCLCSRIIQPNLW